MSATKVPPYLATILFTFMLALPARAVTQEQFRLRTGDDIVALCSTPTSDPLYVAAIHLCQGFGAGVYQTLVAVENHRGLQPLVCAPNPPPTRNDAVRMFLDWAPRNREHLGEAPADVVGRFLIETFPCPKSAQ